MIVSNASPLIVLAKLQRLEILKDLFGKVVIPRAVYQETVEHERVPTSQRQQIQTAIAEGYIEIIDIEHSHEFSRTSLGYGEQGVLQVALAHHSTRLIIDDHQARNEAKELGFESLLALTTDILKLAAERGLIEYAQIMNTLREQGVILPEE